MRERRADLENIVKLPGARANSEDNDERRERGDDDKQHGRRRPTGKVEVRKHPAVDEGREHVRLVGGPAAGQDIDDVENSEGVRDPDHQYDGDDRSKERQGAS